MMSWTMASAIQPPGQSLWQAPAGCESQWWGQNFLSPAKPPGPRAAALGSEITPSRTVIQAGPSRERHWLPGRAAAPAGAPAQPGFHALPVPGRGVPRAALLEPRCPAAPLPASFPTPSPPTPRPASRPSCGGPEDLCPQFQNIPAHYSPGDTANNVTSNRPR